MGRSCRGLGLFLALLPLPLAAAPPRAGGEFRVNTYTTDQQSLAAVASDASGRFVVVWESAGQDGDSGGVFGQRFDAAGTPLGAEFQASVYATNRQGAPAVAMAPSGSFVVVWTSVGGQDGDATGVFGRHFDADGSPVGGEFQVNQHTTAGQFAPAIAADAAGNFVVAWASTGPTSGVRGRRFDSSLVGGTEVPLESGVANVPALGLNPNGTLAATWSSFGEDGSDWGVFGRRFNATLAPVGSKFAVNTYTSLDQDRSAVVATGGGAFAVVWQSETQDGEDFGVFARRFDSTGSPLGGEFAVNTYTNDGQQTPRVAADGNGGFLVVWESWLQDGDLAGVFARAFDGSGDALDPEEVLVNTNTAINQRGPSVASDPDGRFVVAWHGFPSDGGGSYSVRAQRYGDLIFKDGFEMGTLEAWSSAAIDGGQLTASATAALAGTSVGLEGEVDDVNALFVQDDSPADEGRYRARFYLEPNGFDPGEAQLHFRVRTFIAFSEAPTRRLAAVVLRRIGNAYSLRGRARLDDNTQADTPFFPIDDRGHAVEIDLVRASGPGALDGTFELWIDGVSMVQLTGLNNSGSEVDFVRLGALSVKVGASGTLHWDEFESRRLSPIGVLP